MPFTEKQPSPLSVLEVEDPKQCVLIHLMTLMEPIEPLLESPLARPLQQQKTAASDLLSEIGKTKTATEGMLLSNMEKNGRCTLRVAPESKIGLEMMYFLFF